MSQEQEESPLSPVGKRSASIRSLLASVRSLGSAGDGDAQHGHGGSGRVGLSSSGRVKHGSGKLLSNSERVIHVSSGKSRGNNDVKSGQESLSPLASSQVLNRESGVPHTGVLPPKHGGRFMLGRTDNPGLVENSYIKLDAASAQSVGESDVAVRASDGMRSSSAANERADVYASYPEAEAEAEGSFKSMGQTAMGQSERGLRSASNDGMTSAANAEASRRRHSSADERLETPASYAGQKLPSVASQDKTKSVPARKGTLLNQDVLRQANLLAPASNRRSDETATPQSLQHTGLHALQSTPSGGNKRQSAIRQARTSLLAGVDTEKLLGKAAEPTSALGPGARDSVFEYTQPLSRGDSSADPSFAYRERSKSRSGNLPSVTQTKETVDLHRTHSAGGASKPQHSSVAFAVPDSPETSSIRSKTKRVSFSRKGSGENDADESLGRSFSKKVGFGPLFGRSKSKIQSEDDSALSSVTETTATLFEATSQLPSGRSRTMSISRARRDSIKTRPEVTPGALDLLIERSKSSVLEQDERTVARAVAEMIAPIANSTQRSTLECLVLMLRGTRVQRRSKGFRKYVECFVYLGELLDELHWMQVGAAGLDISQTPSNPQTVTHPGAAKESVSGVTPSTSGNASGATGGAGVPDAFTHKGSISLLGIERIKCNGLELNIEFGSEGDSFDAIFWSKDESEVWATGMSCLVPLQARVKMRSKVVEQREKYNMFLDTFDGVPLFKRQRVDRFIILSQIGDGANSVVKLALSMEDTMFYAVKVVPKSLLRKQNRGGVFGNKNGKTGIGDNREIAIMKKLKHGNIVRMKDVYDDPENDCIYIVLEYMPGGFVMSSAKLEGGKPMRESSAREVFLDVLAGLEYLHKRGILHRDLKPENLLRKCSGVVKISDFGSAKLIEGGAPNTSVGTPAFTPPELCLSDKAPLAAGNGTASDVWSLGVTLYYLLFGRVPFIANGVFPMYEAICTQELVLPKEPPISEECRDVLRLILNKSDKERLNIAQIWQHPWVRDAMNLPHCRHQERILRAGLERLHVGGESLESTAASHEQPVHISEDDVQDAVRKTVMTDDPENMPEDLVQKKNHAAFIMRQASRGNLDFPMD